MNFKSKNGNVLKKECIFFIIGQKELLREEDRTSQVDSDRDKRPRRRHFQRSTRLGTNVGKSRNCLNNSGDNKIGCRDPRKKTYLKRDGLESPSRSTLSLPL